MEPNGPHAKNLRKGRFSALGLVYALTKCTRGRERLFSADGPGASAAGCIIATIEAMDQRGIWTCFGYVVMPDHMHAVVKLRSADLSGAVKLFSMLTTREVNIVLGRQGALWQPGFHDHALRSEQSLENHLRYIHQNPVRAGLVNAAENWPHGTLLFGNG